MSANIFCDFADLNQINKFKIPMIAIFPYIQNSLKDKIKDRKSHLKNKNSELGEILKETEKEEKTLLEKSKEFEKKVNPDSVVWQNIETDYWSAFLKKLVLEHSEETGSNLSKQIADNFENELKNFVQVCPKEMVDKLNHPISTKTKIQKVS